jgi:hypothetical protein
VAQLLSPVVAAVTATLPTQHVAPDDLHWQPPPVAPLAAVPDVQRGACYAVLANNNQPSSQCHSPAATERAARVGLLEAGPNSLSAAELVVQQQLEEATAATESLYRLLSSPLDDLLSTQGSRLVLEDEGQQLEEGEGQCSTVEGDGQWCEGAQQQPALQQREEAQQPGLAHSPATSPAHQAEAASTSSWDTGVDAGKEGASGDSGRAAVRSAAPSGPRMPEDGLCSSPGAGQPLEMSCRPKQPGSSTTVPAEVPTRPAPPPPGGARPANWEALDTPPWQTHRLGARAAELQWQRAGSWGMAAAGRIPAPGPAAGTAEVAMLVDGRVDKSVEASFADPASPRMCPASKHWCLSCCPHCAKCCQPGWAQWHSRSAAGCLPAGYCPVCPGHSSHTLVACIESEGEPGCPSGSTQLQHPQHIQQRSPASPRPAREQNATTTMQQAGDMLTVLNRAVVREAQQAVQRAELFGRVQPLWWGQEALARQAKENRVARAKLEELSRRLEHLRP